MATKCAEVTPPNTVAVLVVVAVVEEMEEIEVVSQCCEGRG